MGLTSLPTLLKRTLREIVPVSRGSAARRLTSRARAAKDGRQFGIAAALYEEALRFNPHNPRLRIQCGHMFKEAGDLIAAEEQYALALLDLPHDADLALQIGHLHKVAGRPDRAKASYARALELNPGWREAERELASVSIISSSSGDQSPVDWIVPELLPRENIIPSVDRNILRLFRLGGRRIHSRWGDLKAMRGIEAIRGYRLAPEGLAEIRLSIDNETVHRENLRAYRQGGEGSTQFKYVFNVWHDFSATTPGRHLIELSFHDRWGRRIHRHQEAVMVLPPHADDDYPASDAFVPGVSDTTAVEEEINHRPSIVRSVERRLIPDPVRTILVQRVDQLGDLVCSIPAIHRLRELFPQARLIGLMTPANLTLAEHLKLFDEIVVVAFSENAAERRRVLSAESQGELHRALAPYQFDIAVDLGEGEESRPLLLLSGARFLYGFKDHLSPWLDAGLNFNAHDPINTIEIVPPSRKMMLLVEGLGVLARGQARIIANGDRSVLADYGIDDGERYAVLHAGARLAYSRWPYFGALARLLIERTDLKILVFSDDPEVARQIEAEVGVSHRLRVMVGLMPFANFDALLSHCAAFVGNDSGPKHLAALRGAPVVSLHMARLNWSEWGQEMSGRIISRRVPCAGCGIGLDGEDCGKDFACLRHIRPEEVLAAVEGLLSGSN